VVVSKKRPPRIFKKKIILTIHQLMQKNNGTNRKFLLKNIKYFMQISLKEKSMYCVSKIF
jgi:hypothetical protein